MFSATLIVFRESLEAALFIGIVAAATRRLSGRAGWLTAGVAVGVVGALALAWAAQGIAAWLDGVGQDVVNIAILSLALLMLLWHCIWVASHSKGMVSEARALGTSVSDGQRKPWALLAAVALAVLREGAETVLFVGGTLAGAGTTPPQAVATACALGLGLGSLAGLLIYAGLTRIPAKHLFSATNLLIALLAGSIASQLAKALAQAGFVDTWSTPLWDSSRALAPDSPVGTLLHALVGYDARPSGAQLAAYLAVLAFIYVGTRLPRRTQAP